MKNLSQEVQGYIYAILAFIQWGLFPIYFKLINTVPPIEVLAHRIIWSVILLLLILALTQQMRALKQLIFTKNAFLSLSLSAFLISSNWLIYIWAISHDMLTEASLGYYINPLISAMLGILIYKDRPTTWQKIAIALAFCAIVYQIITLGTVPLVSLGLGFSFGFYGLVRKQVNLPSALGLTIETLILLPMALGYFIYLLLNQESMFIVPPDKTTYLLSLAGFVTVLPLLCFNAATTKISLMYIGFFQYISPTIGFLLAIFVYDEVLTSEKLTTFIIIWIALVIFSIDAYRNRRKLMNK